jgi:hypothetical protein
MYIDKLELLGDLCAFLGCDNQAYLGEQEGAYYLTADKAQGTVESVFRLLDAVEMEVRTAEECALFAHCIQRLCGHWEAKRTSSIWLQLMQPERAQYLERQSQRLAGYCQDPGEVALTERMARMHFFQHFSSRFSAGLMTPWLARNDTALRVESVMIATLSERIWSVCRSPSGQQAGLRYEEVMEELIRGTHIVFMEVPGQPALDEVLEKRINAVAQGYFCRQRASSHYRLAGYAIQREGHPRISGLSLLPENLLCPVTMGMSEEGTLFTGLDVSRAPDGAVPVRVTAFQTENFSDSSLCIDWEHLLAPCKKERRGPVHRRPRYHWLQSLLHRLFDFVLYGLRRMLRYERVNVAKHGYGRGDKDPLILPPAAFH